VESLPFLSILYQIIQSYITFQARQARQRLGRIQPHSYQWGWGGGVVHDLCRACREVKWRHHPKPLGQGDLGCMLHISHPVWSTWQCSAVQCSAVQCSAVHTGTAFPVTATHGGGPLHPASVLHCTAHCTALHCTLYCTALHTTMHCTALH
jgi:hypothetical protein